MAERGGGGVDIAVGRRRCRCCASCQGPKHDDNRLLVHVGHGRSKDILF